MGVALLLTSSALFHVAFCGRFRRALTMGSAAQSAMTCVFSLHSLVLWEEST